MLGGFGGYCSLQGRDARSETRTQGAPVVGATGATEDAVSGRRARPGNSAHIRQTPLEPARHARGGTLVLGGGFAGSYVARLLGNRGATIVSLENFMLFTPLLPEAASGTLEPRHVVVPLRLMCPHADLLLGQLTALDPAARTATVETEA